MEDIVKYLNNEYPNSEVFPSVDKDFVCIRSIVGQSNFGKNDAGQAVVVPITNMQRFHVDTIRLKMASSIEGIKDQMNKLTDDERMEVMGNYCKYCGCNDSGCQCWNDD